MKYIKLFESFNLQEMLDKVDDIAAYLPTHTSPVESKWVLPNFDTKRILDDKDYKKHKGSDKSKYLRYYIFGFHDLSNFFKAEEDLRGRCKTYGLKYFIINFNQQDRQCRIVFFSKEDWEKLDLEDVIKNVNKKEQNRNWDILFEEDVIIDRNEFDIVYEDDEIMAVSPKTYKAAIKYAAGASWAAGLKKSQGWIEKYMTPGAYYGGTNWYKSTTVKKEVETWWQKLLKLPPKQSEVELKEFFNDFPRYLFYIVIFKNLPIEDDMSKLYLLYDISRAEYGELPHSYTSDYAMFGGYWGDMLDSAHNQLRIMDVNSKRITLKDVHKKHGELFNRAFREIEWNMNEEKERMYDLLGFWADKGGEYRDDALVFIRSSREPDRLQVTKPNLITRDKGTISWTRLGYYDDPNFDWWELEREKPSEKAVPNQGKGFGNFFKSMQDDYLKLKNALEDEGWKL
jgi:hypothetical protein